MIRSPLFYVGDKYKLMPQLINFFPKNINTYYEPFYGGGSSQLQIKAKKYKLNDFDKNIISIHKMLISYVNDENLFFSKLLYYIGKYNLSCSFIEDVVSKDLKNQYPKTYYAHYNKNSYELMKKDYNRNKDDVLILYLLLIYGFNHMIRFNKNGDFNLPVGNVDFNKNVFNSLNSYFNLQKNRDITFSTEDFEKFIRNQKFNKNDFIYLDPPYLIGSSEYNKTWTEEKEIRLYNLLDELDKKGVKFGISNLVLHKDKKNEILDKWSQKYKIEYISSNYISYNDNSIKKNSIEIYVHN